MSDIFCSFSETSVIFRNDPERDERCYMIMKRFVLKTLVRLHAITKKYTALTETYWYF